MNPASSIAWHIFAISSFLSVTWGVYLIGMICEYRNIKRGTDRRRGNIVVALRKVVVAFCLWTFVFSFVFRTAMVIAGFGEDVAGQIVFFTLVGTNVVGSMFAVISMRYD